MVLYYINGYFSHCTPAFLLSAFFLSVSCLKLKEINMFIKSVVLLKTIPNFRPKWQILPPIFKPKQLTNYIRLSGGTDAHIAYTRSPSAAESGLKVLIFLAT